MAAGEGKPLEGFEADALLLLRVSRSIVREWGQMPVHPKGSHRVAAAVDRLREACDQVDAWFEVEQFPQRPD